MLDTSETWGILMSKYLGNDKGSRIFQVSESVLIVVKKCKVYNPNTSRCDNKVRWFTVDADRGDYLFEEAIDRNVAKETIRASQF